MNIPLSWLKEYIDINLAPAAIEKLLCSIGLEVDAIHTVSLPCKGVVVGRVLSTERHPNAEKLVVAQVTDGKETFQVVCGAPNCRAGIKTAFAKVGAVLQDEKGQEYKIKQSKLRGVDSSGMLCSEKEVGISGDQEGIVEFDMHLAEGADISELYADHIFAISLTPNLAHCWSVAGVARELSALTGIPFQLPIIAFHEEEGNRIENDIKVEVEDKEGCPRYSCRLVTDVAVGPSPEWLKKKLEVSGLRSVNNIVDITNFVLLELGHPLHSFDYDSIAGKRIIVKKAEAAKAFTSLDQKERLLDPEDLLICDAEKPIALAGVIGGANSEVGEKTRNVLIEAAYFKPSLIRRTSKRLGLQTDASKRFERGTDPNILEFALNRAAMLMHEIAGGKAAKGVLDKKEREFEPLTVSCRLSRVNALLGTRLSASEMEALFSKLEFPSQWIDSDSLAIKVPTYRVDIKAEIDLIEEIARFYGYDNIESPFARFASSILPNNPIYNLEKEVRTRLLSEGLQEFLTCDLIGPSLLKIIGNDSNDGSMVKVLNPNSVEQSILRTTLLPGLLQVLKNNYDKQNHNISGFEIGRIHFKEGDKFKEQTVAAVIITGKKTPHHWDANVENADFYDLKGILENLLEELNIPDISFQNHQNPTLHPGRQASIHSGTLMIGALGEVHPEITTRLDFSQKILFAEINLQDLFRVRAPSRRMEELPVFPCSDRDWTVTLPSDMPISSVLADIKSIPSRLLEKVELLYIYKSDKIGENKINATFHFVYRDRKKTVSQETVDAEHQRIMQHAESLIKK